MGSHQKETCSQGKHPRFATEHKERGQSSSSTSLGVWPNPYLKDESDIHVLMDICSLSFEIRLSVAKLQGRSFE